jgi:hypothetical protein
MDPTLAHPLNQAVQAQRLRSYPIQWGQMATQYVVAPPKIGGAIDHSDGRGLLYDADEPRIPPGISTDVTGLILCQIAAFFARPDPLGDRGQHRGQPPGLFGRLLQQMEGEPLRSLPADPRKPGELRDQLLDRTHCQKGDANGSGGTLRISAWSISAALRWASATAVSTRSLRNSAS